jgi:hypothetical protein
MVQIDPEREKERLSELYSRMSDGELQKIGRDPSGLTEWAKTVLAEEMQKRGLEWSAEPKKSSRSALTERSEIVRLGSYPDELAAELIAAPLQKSGLDYFHVQGTKVDGSEAAGRDIFVRREDLEIARSLLGRFKSSETLEPATGFEEFVDDEPVILRRYRDMPLAYADKSALESAGIQCFLWNANLVRMDWLWSNALDGIKLVVRKSDAEDAARILDTQVEGDSRNP